MRSLVLIAAILCVAGTVLCQTPPKLPQQFYTNFTLVLPGYVSPTDSPVFVSGFFALDYKNAGSFLEVGGEEYVPLSFHTSLVASPDGQGAVTGYMYEGPLCWNFGSIPASLLIFFPFQLPSNASFVGNKVVAGQACTGWEFEAAVFGVTAPVTIWVSTKSTTIVQIDVDDLEYLGDLQLNFFNTVAGPFSPSIYAPPNKVNPKLDCTNPFETSLLARFFRN
jgi:hypothetical protein